MQRITILTVGRLKAAWAKDACEEYGARLRPSATFAVVELPAGKSPDPVKQREEESRAILKALSKTEGDMWLLDEKGERMTSHEFAFVLSQARDSGTPLTFILGGAYGVAPDVRTAVRRSLRLSDMTLPHELCRVFFLEQLYRGFEIAKGSGYHH